MSAELEAPGSRPLPTLVPSTAKILLVDDQPKNLLALNAMLEPLGQELVQASSGKEALRYLLRDEFALVLLDVQMPVLDGYEVAELIRAREKSRAVPIIFLTAIHRDQGLVARAYTVGAVDYILKPIDPEILRSKVSVFIELYQKGQIIARQAEELRRATERELADFKRSSEQRYTMLAESMPQVVWTTDEHGVLRYGNRRWFECAGVPETEAMSWRSIVHPLELADFEHGLADAIAEERAWEAEFRLGNAQQRRFRWHLVRMLPERDASGSISGWVGTSTDIDARKRAEQALQMLAALTRHLGELSDRSHGVDRVLASTLPLLGDCAALYLRVDEQVSKSASASLLTDLNLDDPRFDLGPSTVCFDGKPEIVKNVAEVMAQSGQHAGEHVWFLHELGVSSYICWPLFVRERVFGSLVFLNRDPERHYQDSDVELAKDVASRMATALDNVGLYELAQSERAKLQEANRAKDMFLATVSHELRTPLNAIVGWGQMLRSGGLTEETEQRAIDTIERNGRALAQLVADLLDVSRVVSGNLQVEEGQVDLRSIVEAAWDAARPVAVIGAVELTVNLPERPMKMRGDGTRLQQVVGNILGNALKFTPRGGHVTVTLKDGSGLAHLEVTDDGPGIAPDFLPSVFDRFKQAAQSPQRVQRGLGLGLAIVKHLVELHGGTVTAHSDGIGKGARFVVTLPLGVHRADDSGSIPAAAPDAPAATDASAEERPALAGIYALLVEDDPDGCDLMQMMLRRFGAEVTAVSTAAAALESVRERRPDVLVSDIGLPDGDGFSLLKLVRESNHDLPAVAVTAYASRQDVAKALAAGFQAHVAKPVEPAQLSAAVAQASGR